MGPMRRRDAEAKNTLYYLLMTTADYQRSFVKILELFVLFSLRTLQSILA